tara:strand:- start:245 stop:469 length:225 start_codon:yes stop_codon:yes gene_type:complete
MTKYHRTADVEFSIFGSDQSVTVRNLPYCVSDGDFSAAEVQASIDAIKYLRELGVVAGLGCISLVTSPRKAEVL